MDLAYNLALFLHIAGVLVLFGALAIEGISLRGMRASAGSDEARLWLGSMG